MLYEETWELPSKTDWHDRKAFFGGFLKLLQNCTETKENNTQATYVCAVHSGADFCATNKPHYHGG